MEYKLVDVPDLNYLSTDKDENGNLQPRGEIWVRGANVIPGYFKQDLKNKETFTDDGWLMSGDIGMITLPEGHLTVIDRKKNIFKLSQGEYIAPEKLENAYKFASHFIDAIFVHGDSKQSYLIAIVQVLPENYSNFLRSLEIT